MQDNKKKSETAPHTRKYGRIECLYRGIICILTLCDVNALLASCAYTEVINNDFTDGHTYIDIRNTL